MNKKNNVLKIFAFSIISILICTFTCTIGIISNYKWTALIVGIILTIASIPIHFMAKKNDNLYLLSYFINMLGTGLSISFYYKVKDIPFKINQVLTSILISVILLFIVLYILKKFNTKFMYKTILTIVIIITIIVTIFWISNEKVTFYSILTFLLILSVFYIILFYKAINEKGNIYKDISKYSYGIYFVITMIVIAILTEGDIDFDFGYSNDKNKKKSS